MAGDITAGTVIAGVVVIAGVPGISEVHFDQGPQKFAVQQPGFCRWYYNGWDYIFWGNGVCRDSWDNRSVVGIFLRVFVIEIVR